ALMALLVLPLAVPVLIFGVASVESLAAGEGSRNALVLLAAFFLVALASTPWAMAAALRQAVE
ncbi:MAG: heme exporter protein CcmB, partial [Reyranellaceae bacterium]